MSTTKRNKSIKNNPKIAEEDKNKDDNKLKNALKGIKEINRMSIYSYLRIYEKLSFQEIQNLLGNISKSTVSHHIQELITSGFIEETFDEDKSHGNIKKYKLRNEIPDFSVTKFDENQMQINQMFELFNFGKFFISFMGYFLNQMTDIANELENEIRLLNDENLREIIKKQIKFEQNDKLSIELEKELERESKKNIDEDLDLVMTKMVEKNISEIISLIKGSNMDAFPLTEEDYQIFLVELMEFVGKFKSKIKKKKYLDKNEKIYWVLYLNFPYIIFQNKKVSSNLQKSIQSIIKNYGTK